MELSDTIASERVLSHRSHPDSIGVMAFKVLRQIEHRHDQEDHDICSADTTSSAYPDCAIDHAALKPRDVLVDEASQTDGDAMVQRKRDDAKGTSISSSPHGIARPAVVSADGAAQSNSLRLSFARTSGSDDRVTLAATPPRDESISKLDFSAFARLGVSRAYVNSSHVEDSLPEHPSTTTVGPARAAFSSISVPHSPDIRSGDGTPLATSRTTPDTTNERHVYDSAVHTPRSFLSIDSYYAGHHPAGGAGSADVSDDEVAPPVPASLRVQSMAPEELDALLNPASATISVCHAGVVSSVLDISALSSRMSAAGQERQCHCAVVSVERRATSSSASDRLSPAQLLQIVPCAVSYFCSLRGSHPTGATSL